MAGNNSNGGKNGPRKSFKLYGVVLLVVAAGGAAVWLNGMSGGAALDETMPTFAAQRGPLRICVLESGTIRAREQETIYNQVEGRTTIVRIVPEGTIVKAGDVLVELDVSTLKDSQIDQDIRVQNAWASLVNARENLEIIKSQATSDVNKADLALVFAKQDLEKYKLGEYPNKLESTQSRIDLAKEQLAQAKQTLDWSKKLFDEKYISKTEFERDQLSLSRAAADVNIADNERRLLIDYTNKRDIAQMENDVQQAEMALDRAKRKANANVVQAEADLRAREQEHNRQKEKLAKIEDQINKATIVAPREGMVVYATSNQGGGGGRMRMDNRQPLQEGVEVFERQELIQLPTAASVKAEVAIHEASMQKTRVGLPAVITVDALQGKQFFGSVVRIAPLPDPQSMWMNPDLKIYNSDVWLEGEDPNLRTGMSCRVEIVVADYPDAIYVPVAAVLRVEGKPTVYVVTPDGKMEPRKVEIGLDNDIMVRIISGLEEGEVVSLAPPLKAATAQFGAAQDEAADANNPANSMTQRISQRLTGSDGFQVPGGEGQDPSAGRGGRRGGMGGMRGMRFDPNMTPEQRQQAMQKAMESMTPEQRQQMDEMRKRMESMTPEERQQMQGRRGQGFGGGRGGRGGSRGGPGQDSGGPEGGQ